ncbi:CapA family protein [Nocardioides sp. B-3]|uniref:CapA family protein n=1 Tax=Nocardioides sp. B-3 TaxID=2895565 RepID=UPI002152C134|nr:CapA family protein [Nocardioides sp. B-3]UUZ58885.1 CapA family protein [Nocardioides sp. B-3]
MRRQTSSSPTCTGASRGEACPTDDQRSLAAELVAAGADVIVGSHAHQLRGDGRLGPGYVAYGLGNYARYTEGATGVLTLTVRPPSEPSGRARVIDHAWAPARIGTDGLPRELADAGDFNTDRAALRRCAGF